MTGPVHYTAVLDARLFDPLERLPRIVQSVAALSPGETLLLVTGQRPERLPGYLRQELGDRVSWEPVAEGPPVWRVCLRRR